MIKVGNKSLWETIMKLKWKLVIYIFFVIAYVYILHRIGLSLGTTWVIVTGIATIFGYLAFTIDKKPHMEPLKTFLSGVFIVSLISSILYSVINLKENLFSLNTVDKTSIINDISKIPQKSKNIECITPEDLKKELEYQPIVYFEPDCEKEHFVNLFLTSKTNIKIKDDVMEKQELLFETVKEDIENNMGTIDDGDYDKLNINNKYTNLIREASEYENSLSLNGKNIEIYNNMIRAREDAFNIGKTRELALLLARDYYELGAYYCYSLDEKQFAFNCFIKSIEHYNKVIRLTKVNEVYDVDLGYIFYAIGQVYHSLGDIQYLEKGVRADAYFMSLAYISLSSEQGKDNFYPYYYKAMIEHKLGIIFDKNDDKILNEDKMLLDAKLNYTKSLNNTNKDSTKIDIQKFMAQTCSMLINYYEENDQDKNIDDLVKEKQSLLYSVEQLQNSQ